MARRENNPKRGKPNKPQTKSGTDNRRENAYESGSNPSVAGRSRER